MAMRRHKRRRVLIESYQYRLLFINLVHFLTILVIFAAAIFLPLILELRSGGLSVMEQGEVAGQFLSLHARVWPAMIVIFVLLAVHSVFVSHRIAGPLYRFRTIFKAIAEGDLSVRATLRKGDYLGKESDTLNEMIASLRTKVQTIHAHSQDVERLLVALERSLDRGSIPDANQHATDLRRQMEQLRTSMELFRIHPGENGASSPAAPAKSAGDSAPFRQS